MESILDYVRRRLREVGSQSWEEIAKEVGSSPVTPRKIVYERDNPGVNTVEPYYRYFQRIDKVAATKPPKRTSAGAPTAASFVEKRLPENEGQFIAPKRRSTDRPNAR